MSDRKIISITEKMPHLSGIAKCLACKHEFNGVCRVGDLGMDCPKCGTHRGVFVYQPQGSDAIFECNCGCHQFALERALTLRCLHCGTGTALIDFFEE